MSSRIVRRAFAPAFVVTIATTTVSVAETPAPPKDIDKNPPKPKREPAKVELRWEVTRTPADPKAKPPRAETCSAMQEVRCPPREPGKPTRTCNPPAPFDYPCPATVKDATFKIILSVGATECRVDDPPTKCDPGDKCNPPPPRKVPCPS